MRFPTISFLYMQRPLIDGMQRQCERREAIPLRITTPPFNSTEGGLLWVNITGISGEQRGVLADEHRHLI